MSMTDPIADLLTRIRNAQLARKTEVSVSSSKLKTALVKVLKDEGYVAGFNVVSDGVKQTLSIEVKYFDGRPVRDRLGRVPPPALQLYRGKTEIPKIQGGLGPAIVAAPKGVMADKQARAI